MNNYDNLIGKMFDGRYKLTGIRGIGGMAVVFEADDLAMDRKVAVKILKDEIKEDIQEVKRFINESRAVAMLSHPNIVHIYDVSVKNSENQYIVMELIDGITLKDYIVKRDRLPWREAVSYTEQILNALSHAHSRGIIHRDIKPQNVMLLRNGNLKITDFGIAKMRDSEPLTMTDKAIGTVHYISPEQANGISVTNVSDIYSTGILLYEMSTGKLPFEGDTAINVAMKQISEVPVNPRELNPEIPKGLSQIILKAMSKSPMDRYQNAGEMIKQLSILSANPAVVFNKNHSANPNPGNGNGSNLPVAVSDAELQKAVINGGIEKADKKEITQVKGGKNKIEDIDKINEDEMRRRGRTSKKGVRRRQSRSMLPIISGVTLAFLIVLGVSITVIIARLMRDTPERIEVIIPDYVGSYYNEILENMEEERLKTGNINYAINDDYEEGQIIRHMPVAGDKKVLPNASSKISIDFTISSGRSTYIIEDLSVRESRDVEIMLKAKKIEVDIKYEDHDTIPSNYVIYTDPGPGVELFPGDTIILYVSKIPMPKRVLMPDVTWKDSKKTISYLKSEAEKELARWEIGIKRIDWEYSETIPDGYVIKQDIAPNKEVFSRSTRVVLTISRGSKNPPTEPPTEPPSNTVSAAETETPANTGG